MSPNEPTKAAKKAATVILALFLLLFTKYKPYEHDFYIDSFWKQIFGLYSYVINTTLSWVHEAGHGVCYILRCPDFLTAANGTVFQLLFPFLLGYLCKRQGNLFGYYVGLFFLGFSMQYTAWYISTAHEGLYLSVEKSFLGIDGYHDFNSILSTFGLVKADWFISGVVKTAGYLLMFYSCFKMYLLAWVSEK